MSLYLLRLRRMSIAEWQLRAQSRPSGFLWTLLQPALMFATLSFVFSRWLGPSTPDARARLLVGVVQWGFFSTCTAYGLGSLTRRAPIARNFSLPLEVPVLASAASVAASHLIEMLLLCGCLAALGYAPSPRWLGLLPAETALLALAAGTSLVLAWLAAMFRDVERIWGIALSIGFFLTPVFYDASALPGRGRFVLELNPLTQVLGFSRSSLVGGGLAPARLLPAAAGGGLLLVVGLWLLRRRDARLRDLLY